MRTALPTTLVLLAAAGMPAGQAGPQEGETARPAPAGLLELSRNLTRLKAGATSRVRVYTKSGVHLGLYLGEGMVATSHEADLEPGQTATLRCPAGTYRLVAAGGDSRLKVVTFFKLRDIDHAVHEPEVARLRKPDWRRENGDLVCIVGTRAARLAMVEESISFGWPRRGPDRRHGRMRGGSPARQGPAGRSRFVFAYGMTDASSTPGSSVLAMDGSLVGMLVRRSFGPEGGGKGRQDGTPRPPRRREIALVIDARWLQARGMRLKARPLAARPRPTLGVTLRDPRQTALQWARRRGRAVDPTKLPAAGLLVTSIALGSPADRAGVRPHDLWVSFGGKPLGGLDSVKSALAALPPGGRIEIGYRRDGQLQKLVVAPD